MLLHAYQTTLKRSGISALKEKYDNMDFEKFRSLTQIKDHPFIDYEKLKRIPIINVENIKAVRTHVQVKHIYLNFKEVVKIFFMTILSLRSSS